jgi:hypothetical protein
MSISTVTRLNLWLSAVLLSACGGGAGSPVAPSATPAPAATPAATARYSVTFEPTWSEASHPTDFPGNAHFSPLIGGTHSARVQFWRPGAPATEGIQAMAERGRTSPLDAEVEAAIAAGTAQAVLRGGSIDRLPGSTSFELDVSRDFPLVTLVTMVAPSPDWFVGVHDLDLLAGGDWAAERRVVLYPYDAGTDDGATYGAPDLAARPHAAIAPLEGAPVAHLGSVAPFGQFVFRRLR